jgi:transcription initiation factor TFIIB
MTSVPYQNVFKRRYKELTLSNFKRCMDTVVFTENHTPNYNHLKKTYFRNTMNEDAWTLFDVLKEDLGSGSDGSRCGTPLDKNKQDDELVCESCKSKDIIVEDGQNVCRNCCMIHSRIIDYGAEWRYYGVDDSRGEDPTRCGMPTNSLLPKSSLGSMVGGNRYENKDIRRIRQFQMWNSMPYWERELYRVFEKLSSATSNNGIPEKVLGDSKVLYSRASEMKISRGDNKEGLIASCIFYACAMNGVPRSTKEIAGMFNIEPAVLTKGNARFQSLMKLNIQSPNAVDFISRFASQLGMNWNDIQTCQKITNIIEQLEIVSENAPTSVAAGTVYFYCHIKDIDVTKKQVASVCDVSEVTITKCFKNLQKYKEIILKHLGQLDSSESERD